MALTDRAMLVRLERRNIWRGKVNDSALSEELRKAHNIKAPMAKVDRTLFPGCDPLEPVINAVNHVDYVYRSRTMPWLPGMNIMPSAYFLDFSEAIAKALQEVTDQKAKLIETYDDAVRDGVAASNGLASHADYPVKAAIGDMFNCTISYFPVPSSADWRLPLPEEVVKDISDSLDNANEKLVAETVQHHWKNLISAFDSALKNLNAQRIRPEWLEKLKELGSSLPDLNLAHDPNINYAAQKITDIVGNLELEDVKDSHTQRQDTKAQIETLYDELKEVLG